MKRKVLLLSVSAVFLIASWFIYQNSYTEARTLIWKEPEFIPYKGDSTFYKNLKIALEYHHEKFKLTSDGKVLVKRKLNNDDELMWNFTTKALDTAFIEEIKRSNR